MCEFAMSIYKRYFFDKLQDKLFTILKKINKEENDVYLKNKIETIKKIMGYLDLVKPRITQDSKTSVTWEETSTDTSEKLNKYQKLFNNFKI